MEGSLTLRKDGRWMGRYYENGVQKSVYGRTKIECKDKLKKAIEDKESRSDNRAIRQYDNITLKDFIKDFLEIFKKPVVKELTYFQMSCKLKKYDNISLWKKKMSDITHYDLNEFFTNCDVKYLTYSLLKEIFEKAKEIGFIKYSPMAMVAKPKKDTIDSRVAIINEDDSPLITEDELKKIEMFMSQTPTRARQWMLIYLMYWTGLRIGEALALTKGDIDFTENYILVCKSYNDNVGISSTKTKKGTRKVPILKPLRDVLKNYISNCKKERIFDFTYANLAFVLKEIRDELGIHIKTHSLRKTFISLCQFKYGIAPNVVAQWVGHESIDVTNKYYTFLTSDANKQSIKNIDSQVDTSFLVDVKENGEIK